MSPCCQFGGATVCTDVGWPKSYYQPLFDHMLSEHGLTLLDSEMDEIIRVVDKMESEAMPIHDRLFTHAWSILALLRILADQVGKTATIAGGEKMAAKKVSKAAPKKPSKPVGKKVAKKR